MNFFFHFILFNVFLSFVTGVVYTPSVQRFILYMDHDEFDESKPTSNMFI